MGYTHYWEKEPNIELKVFDRIIEDFTAVLPELRKHVALADASGDGELFIGKEEIRFNGARKCGHKKMHLSIPWPSQSAGGVAIEGDKPITGSWFAGHEIETRVCSGDCSYESFIFQRVTCKESDEKTGLVFDCCKTAFRPYDLAVITFLIIAKHHLGGKIRVASDGEDQHWFDGKMICQTILGYGLQYVMGEEGLCRTGTK